MTTETTASPAITAEEFAPAAQKLINDASTRCAVAVSGGGDSLALALLLQEYAPGRIVAFTVDHGLRAESRAEAEEVQKILRQRGIYHEILNWEGEKPATHIQERARQARYDLLFSAAVKNSCAFLAVAHNSEDQAETFWMRLAHGSGLDGLAGMPALRREKDVTLIRPVLGFSRARLRATCARFNAEWIEDPSNSNDKYLRVRLRAFEDMLAGEGFTPERLAATLRKLEDARDALQVMTAEAAKNCLVFHAEGYATLRFKPWRALPREIQRRLLHEALQGVSPQPYPLGFEGLETARQEMADEKFPGQTLAGCEIISAGDAALVVREAASVAARMTAAEGAVWDARFIVSGVRGTGPLDIGALGETGLSALRQNPALEKMLKAIPFKARRVMPALWSANDTLMAVPHIGYFSEDCPLILRNARMVFRKI